MNSGVESSAMTKKNPHAVALGALGGAATKGVTSKKKAETSRANAEKAREARRLKMEAKKKGRKK